MGVLMYFKLICQKKKYQIYIYLDMVEGVDNLPLEATYPDSYSSQFNSLDSRDLKFSFLRLPYSNFYFPLREYNSVAVLNF